MDQFYLLSKEKVLVIDCHFVHSMLSIELHFLHLIRVVRKTSMMYYHSNDFFVYSKDSLRMMNSLIELPARDDSN